MSVDHLIRSLLLMAGTASAALPASTLPAAAPAPSRPAWPTVRTIHDLETLWEVPEDPRGVLFVAHGCSHAGSDWWPPSTLCPHCLGLPEETAIRRVALRRGYAVVAVSSFNRTSGCWHNTAPARSEDLQRLPAILAGVVEEEGLGGLPLYLHGASSGGGIVLRLAQVMADVQGVVAQIVPARPDLLVPEEGGPPAFPPLLLVHMAAREPGWAVQIQEALQFCRDTGVPADEVKVAPRPVTARFLRRSPLITRDMAHAAVAALHAASLVDGAGFLLDDPRSDAAQERWLHALQPALGNVLDTERGLSHVKQLLSVAFALHEITSDSTALSLDWLEASGQLSVAQLRRRAQRRRQRRGLPHATQD